jgi:Uma2 family endonuclease
LISLDEYLNTSYRPDAEFVDGVLVERNSGTPLHSLAQVIAGSHLHQYRKSHALEVCMSVRVRLSAERYRVPDLLVLEKPYTRGKFVTDVPAITVEITSPEDTFDCVIDKCLEYETLGVRNILVMDPDNRRAWLFEQNNLRLLGGASVRLNLSQAALDFPFARMFAELDEQ